MRVGRLNWYLEVYVFFVREGEIVFCDVIGLCFGVVKMDCFELRLLGVFLCFLGIL